MFNGFRTDSEKSGEEGKNTLSRKRSFSRARIAEERAGEILSRRPTQPWPALTMANVSSPGVYLDETSRNWHFENNTSAMAGYLGLPDTRALRDFMGDESRARSPEPAQNVAIRGTRSSNEPNTT